MALNPIKAFGAGAVLAIAWAGSALAQTEPQDQTQAGTVVSNTISLTYDGADNDGDIVSITLDPPAPTTFTVARKIDLSVTAEQAGEELTVTPGQTAATTEFTLRNLGNPNVGGAAQDFNINVAVAGNIGNGTAPLTYSATATTTAGQYYVTVGGDVYDTEAGTPVALASGAESTIRIIANVPSGATDGLADLFTVTAIAMDSGVKVVESRSSDLDDLSVVFADAESTTVLTGQTNPIDPALNGEAVALTRLLVTAPQLSATKTAVVLDEGLPGSSFTCNSDDAATGTGLVAIPGACVEYTITVTNAAGATSPASNITIKDGIPGNTTHIRQFADDFDTATYDAGDNEVTATLSTLAADSSASFRIRVTVD